MDPAIHRKKLPVRNSHEPVIVPLVHGGTTEGLLCMQDPARSLAALRTDAAENAVDGAAGFPIEDSKSGNFALLPHVSSKLMRNISHDLRTPITAVRGYLKLVLNGRMGPVSEEQSGCLAGALNGLDQIMEIVHTVGEGAGFLEKIQPEELNLRKIWSNAANLVQDQRIVKRIELHERFSAAVQRVCGEGRIIRDVVERLAERSIAFAGRETEYQVELYNGKTEDVALRISFVSTCPESDLKQVVSELHPSVFLHGGRLAFNTIGENRRSFTLSLPGYDA